MQHLGVRLLSVSEGQVELALPYGDKTTQQQGGFHGGAIGALADIAGGYAALTVVPEGMEVVTVEYKINFLSSYQGGEIRATGDVLVDMMSLLHRTGFDAVALRGDQDRAAAERALGFFAARGHYQGDVRQPRPAFARDLAAETAGTRDGLFGK